MTNWKNAERTVAKFFDTRRTPLSGGNSGHTRSDTLHDKLFIETKYRKGGFSVVNLWKNVQKLAKKEDKIPVVALRTKGSPLTHLVIEVNDLIKVMNEIRVKK